MSSSNDPGLDVSSIDSPTPLHMTTPVKYTAVTTSKRRKLHAARAQQKRHPGLANPGTLVTFLIGPKKTKFVIHKDFVCYHSSVLRAEFNSSSIEGQMQTYIIENVSEAGFQMFSEWLYTKELNVTQLGDKDEDKSNDPESSEEDLALAETWILAEKFSVPSLQNIVVATMYEVEETWDSFPLSCLCYMYSNTSPGSALRRFMVVQATRMMASEFISKIEYLPKVFLAEYAEFIGNQVPTHIRTEGFELSNFHVPTPDS